MKSLLPLIVIGLIATSCVPSTPQTRIQQNPQMFAALPVKDQNLVQRGEIAKGMSPDAVVLAWGPPARNFEGFKDGRSSMRWDYTGTQPVYTGNYYAGYGYGGYGYHHGHGYYGHPYSGYGYGYGFGFAPEFAYIPYRRASVWFINNRVDSWERLH